MNLYMYVGVLLNYLYFVVVVFGVVMLLVLDDVYY